MLTSSWFWAAVAVAVLAAVLLLGGSSECADGYYWEEALGCVRK